MTPRPDPSAGAGLGAGTLPGPPRRKSLRPQAAVLALAAVLLGALLRPLAATPAIDAVWRLDPRGALELVDSPLPALQPMVGQTLRRIVAADGRVIEGAALAAPGAPRWTVDDARSASQAAARQALAQALAGGPVALQFDDGGSVAVQPRPRGLGGIGALFWLMAAAWLSLLLAGTTLYARRPGWRNGLYLALALALGAKLLLIGAESMPGLGLPAGIVAHGLPGHIVLDLVCTALAVHLSTLPPLRVPHPRAAAAAAWSLAALLAAALAAGALRPAWWWLQAAMLAGAGAALLLTGWSYRIEPNPFALVSRRITLAAAGSLALLTVAAAAAGRAGARAHEVASIAPMAWYLFFACLLLLLPFVSRAGMLMREVAIFAGISTVALSLDLLFVSAFGVDPAASPALAILLALLLYGLTRGLLLDAAAEHQALGAGRLFERLYRGVRSVEQRPQDWPTLVPALLRELFDPLELEAVTQPAEHARVLAAGAALLVPTPAAGEAGTAWLLRFSGRGRRLFGLDDARLADGVVEQVRRALAQDHAVERGRSEERARIAQDLHDDIGARLLTLMYRAPSTEIEDYIRHTLKDLKTLTRGLAASEHRLSHAAAEWKADIAQRLGAAQIELEWSLQLDRDLELGVVQWSALTRVLRELVSNVIQHSAATHVAITGSVEDGGLRLAIADDGIGRDPQAWAHGLGLGGVRKRVKQLGGDVQWAPNDPAGIVCTVRVPRLGEHRH